MTIAPNRELVGFTLHTRNSIEIPGPWGALALIWPPAAYAEAMRTGFPAQGSASPGAPGSTD